MVPVHQPPKPMTRTTRFLIHLTEEQKEWLASQASAFRPMAAVIRDLIDEKRAAATPNNQIQ
jgi:hypothetical protein